MIHIPQMDETGEISETDLYRMNREIVNCRANFDYQEIESTFDNFNPAHHPPLVMAAFLRATFSSRMAIKNWHQTLDVCRKSCLKHHRMRPEQIDNVFRGLGSPNEIRTAYINPRFAV